MVKYWDADRFEQILRLPGHLGVVWSLDVSFDGAYCVSAGSDRSLRMWSRTEDMVFVEEERERHFEVQIESSMEKKEQHDAAAESGALPSIESLKGAERLLEALELAQKEISLAQQPGYVASPLLLGQTPLKYIASTLKYIKASDLEQALLVLPFHLVQCLLLLLNEVSFVICVKICNLCDVYTMLILIHLWKCKQHS